MKKALGFTLIEFIIVIVLLSILSSIGSLILGQHFKGYFATKQITQLTTETNIAVDNLMRELKSAGQLTAIDNTTLTFTNQAGETIVIDLNGTTLRRQVNGGTAMPLCSQVSSLAFYGFDASFATTVTAQNVRFVMLQMTTTSSTKNLPYSVMAGTVLRTQLP